MGRILLEIKEDLPFEANSQQNGNMRTVQLGSDTPVLPTESTSNLSKSIGIFHELITKEIGSAATFLEIDEHELKAWIDLQIEVSARTILAMLRTMQHLCLDPLKEEIGFA